MQLEKKYIHKNSQKADTAVQMTLDDDYNIPDYRADAVKIIQSRGRVMLDEIKAMNGHVALKGKMQFWILYQTDEIESKISCLKGEIPIQETVVADQANEYDKVKVQAKLEDLSISMINSRKISIKAWIMLNVTIEDIEDEEVVIAAEGEDSGRIQVRRQGIDVLQLVFQNKDTVRIREDIELPSGKENIQEILWWNVQENSMTMQLKENRLEVSGQLQVFVLYYTQEQNQKLEWYEKNVSFSGSLDINGANEEMISSVKARLANVDLETKADADGEDRVLHMEAVLEFDLHLYEEEKLMILDDVYALDCHLIPEYEQAEFMTLLAKNATRATIQEQVALEAQQESILQVCDVQGDIIVEREEIVEDGVLAEGVFSLQVLYITSKDEAPLGSVNATFPFHQTIEARGIGPQSMYELDARQSQISLTITDSRQIEVKAVIDFEFIGFDKARFSRIKSVSEEPLDMELLQKKPGIVGLIATEEDSLWNIAKQYHTTQEALMEMNQMSDSTLHKGQKIMIVKSVVQ